MSIADAESMAIHLYFVVACVVLWAYDYSLTFASEVSLIWDSPWTPLKVLYIFSRYWSSVALCILIYYHFSDDITVERCLVAERFMTWSLNISMCSAEIILTIRTWAVWERSRKVTIFLCLLFAAIWIPTFILMGFWEGTIHYSAVPREIVPSGCWPEMTSSLYFINYILLAIFEGVLLIMISIKAYMALNTGLPDSILFQAVYLNGVLYYIYLFILSVINIMISMHVSREFANLLGVLQQVMHSLLAGRMLLELREWGQRTVHRCKDFGMSFREHVNAMEFQEGSMPLGDDAGENHEVIKTTPIMLTDP